MKEFKESKKKEKKKEKRKTKLQLKRQKELQKEKELKEIQQPIVASEQLQKTQPKTKKNVRGRKHQSVEDSENLERPQSERELKRNKSKVNLAEGRIILPKQSSQANSKKKPSPKKEKEKGVNQLDQQIVLFLKAVFEVSEKHAFLKNKTFQACLKFISYSMKAKYEKEIEKLYFYQIDGEDLIKSILKVQLKDQSKQGVMYQVCEMFMYLLTTHERKI